MIDTELYRQHLEILDGSLARALERSGRDGVPLEGVLFHAGRARTYHADDREIVFQATPHLRRWVPLEGPEHAVLARPGSRPLVVRVQPQDFWFDTSLPPASYWEEAVELAQVESFEEVTSVTGPLRRIAYVGNSPEAAAQAGIPGALIEPTALMRSLDWDRAVKTEHEAALLSAAAEKGAAGHIRAREAFLEGASELELHRTFLEASGQLEREVPYETIVALDEKSAILHYQNKRGSEAAPGRVFLLDAGAACQGYATDITRTWARPGTDPVFEHLLYGLDSLQRELVALVTPDRPFPEIHLQTHRLLATLLTEAGVIKGGAEEAFERGVTRTFMPHGLGHHLGLQVHDVGGRQAGPEGGTVPPPEGHDLLRTTRTLEPGHYVTIEPGLYFIPMLLAPLRDSPEASLVDWDLVERLTPCGGIRIEDNVLCTTEGPKDLTRPLLAGPRGS